MADTPIGRRHRQRKHFPSLDPIRVGIRFEYFSSSCGDRATMRLRTRRRRRGREVLRRVIRLLTGVVESAGLIVGVRIGLEEPPHSKEPIVEGVELRRYGSRIAAQTVVHGDERTALTEGFRRLAGYIFGGNHRGEKISMTAPVAAQRPGGDGEKIAMTAPVAQAQTSQGWSIRFYMPAQWTMATLPRPDDDRVQLVPVEPDTVAVLRFTGDRGPQAVARRTAQLRELLQATGFEPTGPAASWFYDPPWTLPFRRRNEIAIPV